MFRFEKKKIRNISILDDGRAWYLFVGTPPPRPRPFQHRMERNENKNPIPQTFHGKYSMNSSRIGFWAHTFALQVIMDQLFTRKGGRAQKRHRNLDSALDPDAAPESAPETPTIPRPQPHRD